MPVESGTTGAKDVDPSDERRWRERPLLAASLHAAVVLVPIVLGSVVGVVVNRSLPRIGVTGLPQIGLAAAAAMASVWLIQPLVRRVMPMTWLLRLGMLFPGPAPSRMKLARRAGRVRDLEDELAQARTEGRFEEPQRNAELVLSLVTALTAHDRRTRGHSERTRLFTDLLAHELRLPQQDADRLRWAALLHDIGKLEVPARILNKPGKPTPYEWQLLREHPITGDRMMKPLRPWLGEWADTALHHHERWDGTGYPFGLAGEEISFGARIVAVADAYDVMTAARSYRRPMDAKKAREELVRCSGSQFDPAVVRAFLLIPLSRLRWALGPLSWVAQLPLAREVAHAGGNIATGAGTAAAAAPAAAGAAAAAAAVTLSPTGTPQGPADLSAAIAEPGAVSTEAAASEDGLPDVSEVTPATGPWGGAADPPIRLVAGERDDTTADPRAPDTAIANDRDADRPSTDNTSAPTSSPGTEAPTTEAPTTDDPETTSPVDPPTASPPPDDTRDRESPRAAQPRADPVKTSDCGGDGWEAYGFSTEDQCLRFLEGGPAPRPAPK